jgi:hypothetical protein
MTTLPKGVEAFRPEDPWSNAHQNFRHHYTPGASYALRVFSNESTIQDYNDTTRNIQWIIKQAVSSGTTLRAMGNNWSFSDVSVCPGGMISTKGLNLRFKLGNSSLTPEYLASGKTKDDLLFVQCGLTLLELSELLETSFTPRRSLVSSGASNGQTIAGATSTGTHGGALYTGSVHDAIVGLHIVTGEDQHVWIERSSCPVASAQFINALGAELRRDDELFNSAVISFGSFGVIHGILLETAPIYLLEEHRYDNVEYSDALADAVQTQDMVKFAAILPNWPIETATRLLYHMELAINPHQFEKNNKDKGLYIRTFYKIPCPPEYQPRHNSVTSGLTYGEDLLGVISQLIDVVGTDVSSKLIKPLVNSLFKSGLRAAQPGPKTMGETFKNTRFRGQVASAAFAIDCKDVFRVVELIIKLNKDTPLAGGLAFRFVKGTRATLGFTRFPKTCVVEMDGIDADVTRRFFEAVGLQLESALIPYTLHWGKMNYILNRERILQMYGTDMVNKWIGCRHTLLNEPVRKVFTNDFMTRCGLDG